MKDTVILGIAVIILSLDALLLGFRVNRIETRQAEFQDMYFRHEGYQLDEGCRYDILKTENGYDLVLHYTKEEEDG